MNFTTKSLISLALFLGLALSSLAETDSLALRALSLKVEADAFVVDNEYTGRMVTGYTLPGVWIRPRLTYDPIEAIHLELGAHAIFFNGTSRYPCYAYHDIASWKGSQYQHGVHALPWFRADATIGAATITVGHLHNHSTALMERFHDLTLPLYNPECYHSADPEMGAQLRFMRKRYNADLWIDWQSFIFRLDTHQEAFTAGLTQRIALTRPRPTGFNLSLPLQVLAQHRGGEIDHTGTGAQTLCNLGAGLRTDWRSQHGVVRMVGAEAMYLRAMQQKGKLWPFDGGDAFWGSARMNLWQYVDITAGYFRGHNFASLYGAGFFGTLSQRDGSCRPHTSTGYYNLTIGKTFAERYRITGFVQGFICQPSDAPKVEHSLSIGVNFHADMDFLLKDFKRKKH